ncbi:MAG: UDP-N-acetylmuramoyl-L-alanyl-D-glutamate--2,6-diaminopimelate ligase, partial [Rikenellaceae bacterium]|nr:UDP-N-acetylmuramoyl-L-alanyl-D-glutamate--2,6-diaminopimelate ligase [Rikenellaceae bacterium]
FNDNPTEKVRLLGVTGTNGKTTIATLLYDLVVEMGWCAGLISTVEYRINGEVFPSTHTTPDSVALNRMMAQMVEAGCEYCFMEVSSHSLVQCRVEGLKFAGALFTNITHDHLDYHQTFSNYIAAKKMLFDSLDKGAFALVNVDDRNGEIMVQNCKAQIKRYSLQRPSDYRCKIVEEHFDGMQLQLDGRELWVRFVGRFNANNLTAVYGAALELGFDPEQVALVLSRLHSVRGRMENYRSPKGVTAIVDYAHTPDALENVCNTINELKREGQRLIVLVGCGGDRDKTKRPQMAKIALANSDMAIFTSDNPRSERPEDILADMESGVKDSDKKYLIITDRRQAIATAAALATGNDIILIAGKGHETYQEICGVRHHFDDMEEIKNVLK